ncbi:MAG: tol-pal system-associated acyl-CoA thioesterase [Gammaproteobacteria bacterium]|nr:tol-pal system-associated acyl-CoA thioesterase [Gammaproteobacteria bacterium]
MHQWPVRVYYEDTDAAGVVYHSNYLKYMERARTEWLRSAGFSQPALANDLGVVFVVGNMSINFKTPARFDDQLNVNSSILESTGTRFQFEQNIIGKDDRLICSAEVNIVCVDTLTFKPKRIPEQIKAKLSYDN